MIDEAMRYLGVKRDPDGRVREQLLALGRELTARVQPSVMVSMLGVEPADGEVVLGDGAIRLPGALARTMLADCDQALVLVCTLGATFDAWMRTEQVRDMARAAMLDALGSALVEETCDAVEKQLATRFPGKFLTDRFSPGYGDLPLSVQPSILMTMEEARRTGLTVTDSYLINPQKTVTAFIGVADKRQPARIRGCAHCAMQGGCAYRREGTTCEI